MIKHDVWKSKKYTYYGMEGVQIYLHPTGLPSACCKSAGSPHMCKKKLHSII